MDHVCGGSNPDGFLKLLLLQAYMGTPYISFPTVKDQFKAFAKGSLSEQEERISGQLQYIMKI